MSISKVINILAFIGFCTVLYLCGSWAIGIIQDILEWIRSTGVAQ